MTEENEAPRGLTAAGSDGEREWRRVVVGGRGRQRKKDGDQRGQVRDLRRCLEVREEEEEHRGR